MSETATKPALHYSTLATLSRCGMQAYHRYVEGRISPPGVALIVGKAVHQASEADLVSKMETGALLPEGAVEELAAEALDATWEGEEPLLSDEDRERGVAVVRGEAKDEAVSLSKLHHDEVAPALAPIAVERRLRLELVGFDYDLEGTIDVEEADTIRDRKTSSRAPAEDEAVGHPQLETYAMMRKVIDGRDTKEVALDYLIKSTKKPRAVTVKARAPREFTSILRRIEAASRVFQSGAFYPVDPTGPSGWVCTPRFCGYFATCPYGARRKVQG
ncbi:MAG: PD-(D/E)XK nuclease family protein [Actinomycetota bacterium]|nr:PD-(D/E)XK nuclease family protein [Actinomycetota bacterium]